MADSPGSRAMRSVLRLHRSMTAVIDAELKNGFRLRLIEYEILQQLQGAEAGASLLSEVARGLFVHATTVSIATERLAARDLVVRHGHPTDRRATLVTITDHGREVADAATAALAEVGCGLQGLTADQLASLADVTAVHSTPADVTAAGAPEPGRVSSAP